MNVRQEPIVFAVSALLLGWMGWSLLAGGTEVRGRGRRSGDADAELVRFRAPDPTVALPSPAVPPLSRALFEPPSDTRPLPPLELVEPPREPLAGLLPPTEPGLAPSAYGQRLRRVLPTVDLPDLFTDEEEAALDDEPADAPVAVDLEDLSPSQRAARIQAFKGRYDWVQKGPGELWFGRIENEDRYALAIDPARAGEAIRFVRFDPETGADFYKGVRENQIAIERGTVGSFGFADTVANRIELEARRIGDELTRGSFAEAMQLASSCIEHRLEAPGALEIAERLYRLCAQYDPKDPGPLLGRARCLEAAFDFEGAFAQYQQLLESFGHREEVHTGLARLEERFLMHDQAEARLEEALGMNRGSWVTNFALGGFLVRRGRPAEAIEYLNVASRNAPQDPASLSTRVAIRSTLGDAHLALGDLDEAEAAYRSALQADETHQRALAGLTTASFLAGKTVPAAAAGVEEAGFELLLARGVEALAAGRHAEARATLELAVDADPLRAQHALAALSVLAEVTGHAEEALRFAEEALERDPTSPFALFQRGRLLGRQDDYLGARESLLGALEQELDFEDALVALGEMAFRLGRFEDAERYLERAVGLNAGRAEVHALRGLNLLRLGSVSAARESFEAALAIAPTDPTAQAGRAWCTYLEGDPGEALIQLGHIDEQRRSRPEDDVWRQWASAQIERLSEHLRKVEWTDSFSRKRLANGWQTRESSGPTIALVDGAAVMEGRFTTTGDVRLFRPYQGGDFVSIEADVKIDAGRSDALIGLFAARERPRRDGTEVVAEVSVARHKEGNVQLRYQRVGQPAERIDMRQAFPLGKWARLKIERTGESTESAVTFYLDGIPLAQNVSMPALGQVNSPLLVGLFAEGETAREVSVSLDNVSIVTRDPR